MKFDRDTLHQLEKIIDPSNPEKSSIPIKILGFGEISLVFELVNTDYPDIAYKRLPIFSNDKEVEDYIAVYNEYARILNDDIGILIPEQDAVWFYAYDKKGRKLKDKITLYCVQKKVNSNSICSKFIHTWGENEIAELAVHFMREMNAISQYNLKNGKFQIGLDGQISNWAMVDYDESIRSITKDTRCYYLDTSTPLYKIDGENSFNPELFLKSAPRFLRWILKLFFLEEVVDRYQDFRYVAIDFLANFYKEKKPELIPLLVEKVNKFFSSEVENLEIQPITTKKIEKYYKSDKRIWIVFQNMRKIDRWIRTKLLRKGYDFYLPNGIKR